MFVKNFLKNGGLSMPSITTSSWFSASEPPPPIPPGNMKSTTPFIRFVNAGRAGRLRRALGEEALAPLPGLEDEVAGRVERAERAVEEVVVNVRRSRSARGAAEARVERLPAHADRVDLVDEDDALAAPLAREPLRLPGQDAHDDGVDADEGLREARAGDRDERRVEAGGDRLGEHRLAGAGRAEEEQAALALAAGALERLARLPEGDDPAHLLLRLGLAADVGELHAPVRVARARSPGSARGP